MKDLICNQHRIPRDQWRYGLRSSAATGCGWIATYNALRLMGYRAKPEALIRYYERQLPLVHGNAGTTVLAPAIFFLQQGFPVKITAKRRSFDTFAREQDVCILFFRWRRGWRFGAHFAAVHDRDGVYFGFNTFRTSSGPDNLGNCLDAFLKKQGYFCPVLIGIRDKRKG